MVTPNPAPDSGRPSAIEEDQTASTAGPVTNQDAADRDQNASGNPEAVSQSDLAGSDGAGIRGDYGDAEQTNGLEGGTDAPTDASPDQAGRNPTNAA